MTTPPTLMHYIFVFVQNHVDTRYGVQMADAEVTFTDITDDVAGRYTCRVYGPGGIFVNRHFDVVVSEPVLVTLQQGDVDLFNDEAVRIPAVDPIMTPLVV